MRSLIGVVIGIALAVCGCGGADEPASRPAPSGPLLSKRAFLQRADAICRAAGTKMDAAVDRYGVNSREGIRAIGAAWQDAYDRLARLHGPAEQEAGVQTFLDRKDDAEDVTRQLFAASRDNDDAAVKRLDDLLDEKGHLADRAADAAGLDACSPG